MRKDKLPKQPTPVTLSRKRQIDNEAVFRKANEAVQKDLAKLEKLAKEEGYDSLIPKKDMLLHFYCECSDENCRERITLTVDKYKELHKDRSQFMVIPDHEVPSIESVVAKTADYNVVDKFVTPPETATVLQSTPINNT